MWAIRNEAQTAAGPRFNGGGGSVSRSVARSLSAGVGENESTNIHERKHEAMATVRLVNKDGDVMWSTTQESNGAKFRGASADVADKITKQLTADMERLRRKYAPALFLNRHLRVGIAPRAQLQAAAHPAQAFGRIGSALVAAHAALCGRLHAVGLNRALGLFDQGLRNHRSLRQQLQELADVCVSRLHYISRRTAL